MSKSVSRYKSEMTLIAVSKYVNNKLVGHSVSQ